MILVWEPIIEASDTILVTSEWALYELAKDPKRQVLLSLVPIFPPFFALSLVCLMRFSVTGAPV